MIKETTLTEFQGKCSTCYFFQNDFCNQYGKSIEDLHELSLKFWQRGCNLFIERIKVIDFRNNYCQNCINSDMKSEEWYCLAASLSLRSIIGFRDLMNEGKSQAEIKINKIVKDTVQTVYENGNKLKCKSYREKIEARIEDKGW